MALFQRTDYLEKIRPFYRSDLIKVITGIRRCGKSCLMETIRDELRGQGVPEKDLLFFNLDKRGYTQIRQPEQLDALIAAQCHDRDYKFLFIDEVQNVRNFETVVNAWREEGNISIFITGSNTYLLSGELVTKLTGRHIEFPLFPLAFHEFLAMKRFLGKPLAPDMTENFTEFLRYGAFPKVLEFDDPDSKQHYLRSVIEQVIEKDVRRRCKIRNRLVFDKVRQFFINNFGSIISLQSVEKHFREVEKIAVQRATLKRYLQILVDAHILYRCPLFDAKSRRFLDREGKFYLADTGIYFATNSDGRINYGPVLENILYIYLRSRGYDLSVGRIGQLECDFIARKSEADYAYLQVAMTILNNQATEEREYRPFQLIRDNFPKFLFTLDPLRQQRDGIRHLNLLNFIANAQMLDNC